MENDTPTLNASIDVAIASINMVLKEKSPSTSSSPKDSFIILAPTNANMANAIQCAKDVTYVANDEPTR